MEIEKQKEELQDHVYRQSKLASIGQLGAGLAHEVNNPLQLIIGFTDLIQQLSEKRELISNTEIKEHCEEIYEAAKRMQHVIRNFREFARQDQVQMEVFDVNDSVKALIGLVDYQMHSDDVTIKSQLDLMVPKVYGSKSLVDQVLMNLVVNARDAIFERKDDVKGEIVIQTEARDQEVLVSVKDNGVGISEDKMADIFNPFFTTKDKTKGTGLGLSITHSIVAAHDGRVRVVSTPKVGTKVMVYLPMKKTKGIQFAA